MRTYSFSITASIGGPSISMPAARRVPLPAPSAPISQSASQVSTVPSFTSRTRTRTLEPRSSKSSISVE